MSGILKVRMRDHATSGALLDVSLSQMPQINLSIHEYVNHMPVLYRILKAVIRKVMTQGV